MKGHFLLPIKINAACVSESLHRFIPSLADPRPLLDAGRGLSREEFTAAISSVYVNSTWKTTCQGRHLQANQGILELASSIKLRILDVGISDGITSLDLISTLDGKFASYSGTDVCLSVVAVQVSDGTCFLYRSPGESCFMRAGPRLILYGGSGSKLRPVRNWVASQLANSPEATEERAVRVNLVQPELASLAESDDRVEVIEWDMFDTWRGAPSNFVKVANVLNRSYFSDHEISVALRGFHELLDPGGYLMIVENRECEQWSLFQKDGTRFCIRKSAGRGSDIDELIINQSFPG